MSDDKSNEHDDDIRTGIPRAFRLDVIGRDARRKELDEEIAFHLESRVAQLMRTGLSEEAARAEAVARFAGAGASLDAAIEQIVERIEDEPLRFALEHHIPVLAELRVLQRE